MMADNVEPQGLPRIMLAGPRTNAQAMTASRPSSSANHRPWANLLSTLLFIAAIGFAVAAIYLYVSGQEQEAGPPRALATPGANEAATVLDAFRAQGLSADYQRYNARADQLTPPGQVLEVNGFDVLVFIYTADNQQDALATREAEFATLDPDTITLTRREAETPLNDGKPLRVYQHSNVIVILIAGDDATATAIQAAVDSLP